jgi:hypothetical protein
VAGETKGLPFIDRLGVEVDADRKTTWEALIDVLTNSLESKSSRLGARVLGSSELGDSGPRPLSTGSTLPGFRVAAADEDRELILDGSHRFARHEMVFELTDLGSGRTELAVVTRAEFPGLIGTLYRALVIGSGGHVIVTRRLLRAVMREAETRKASA